MKRRFLGETFMPAKSKPVPMHMKIPLFPPLLKGERGRMKRGFWGEEDEKMINAREFMGVMIKKV